MKLEVVHTKRFKTAYKRVRQLKSFKREVFIEVVETLASGRKLKSKHRDHALTGTLKDFRECHLAPDIVLIYQIDEGILVLTLVAIGNHAQLFR
jgi:mRNA interferase YafQ